MPLPGYICGREGYVMGSRQPLYITKCFAIPDPSRTSNPIRCVCSWECLAPILVYLFFFNHHFPFILIPSFSTYLYFAILPSVLSQFLLFPSFVTFLHLPYHIPIYPSLIPTVYSSFYLFLLFIHLSISLFSLYYRSFPYLLIR